MLRGISCQSNNLKKVTLLLGIVIIKHIKNTNLYFIIVKWNQSYDDALLLLLLLY